MTSGRFSQAQEEDVIFFLFAGKKTRLSGVGDEKPEKRPSRAKKKMAELRQFGNGSLFSHWHINLPIVPSIGLPENPSPYGQYGDDRYANVSILHHCLSPSYRNDAGGGQRRRHLSEAKKKKGEKNGPENSIMCVTSRLFSRAATFMTSCADRHLTKKLER